MKKAITIFAIIATSAIYAQAPIGMTLIPDYPIDYEIKIDRGVDLNRIRKVEQPIDYLRQSNEIFIRGNFNRVNVIQNIIKIPTPTVDNNNFEYVKTTHFNPQKTLQEILRD